jgi:hypothetical protein
MRKDWIQIGETGGQAVKFPFPYEPDPSLFDIRDQAHALSMLCRYLGRVSRFYSVAEHAVRVSRRVEQLLVEAGHKPYSAEVILGAQWGLIHDNSEAYLGDIPSPWKHTDVFAEYRKYEKPLQSAIAVWLGLPPEEPEIVRRVDSELLGTEARQLKTPIHPEWGTFFEGGTLPPEIPGLRLGWAPALAEATYMNRYRMLFSASP